MKQVKEGDLQKMSLLFDKYHRRLYGFFWQCRQDRAVCEDLVQTVFYRMIKYRESYDESLAFRTWMFALAKNALNDEMNRSKKRETAQTESSKEIGESASADVGYQASEQHRLLSQALNYLPPENRQILLLARYEEMPYREIAGLLHLSEANVKVKVHRAMKELKEVYQKLDK